jgi:uncharacterized protein YyaL (SSP411 family)
MGIFAATYGIAAAHFLEPAVQVVVVARDEEDNAGVELAAAANERFAFNKSVLQLTANQAQAAVNLPPALAETIPHLPELNTGDSFAVLCSGFTCQPPIKDAADLRDRLRTVLMAS